MNRVVVTGLGMVNCLGLDKETSFQAIVDGSCGIRAIRAFDASALSVRIAGEVSDFDPREIIPPKEIKKMDRFIHLGLQAAHEAMDDDMKSAIPAERFGVSSASGIGGLSTIENTTVGYYTRETRRISPFFIPASLVNMLGGALSITHGLKGPNVASVTACSAGTHAISQATMNIMLGLADAMLVVGSEAAICPIGMGGFAAMRALSVRNDDPQKASRPFDRDRDGFVMGEGAGALVLESYESAKKRGAHIYAEIVGFGESGDAHHITSPTIEGPMASMRAALTMAKLDNVDYVNAHGTSTPLNDKNEMAAVKAVFGEKNPPIMSSIKGQIGHCLGAAGAIEAVVTLMALRDQVIPPTINHFTKDPECDLDCVPNVARTTPLEVAMSNSFGFGGTNASVIFKRLSSV